MTGWVLPLLAGPFVGSFLSVVIARMPQGRSIVLGRSACPSCGEALGAFDLAPLLSWAWSRGKCRHCRMRIGFFYPAVELSALAVAAWAAAAVPPDWVWPTCILGWTLLALAVIDHRHFLLPDALTLPLLAAGLGVTWWNDAERLPDHVIGAAAGFAVPAAIAWAYRRLRGRDGLGLGDAKLLAAGGAWVGWQGLAGVVLWGTLGSLALVLARRLRGSALKADTRVAFGPHLALGTWLVWLYGPPAIA